jgi:hypothetical protein
MKKTYTILFSFLLGISLVALPIGAQNAPFTEKQWEEAPVMPGGTIVKTESTSIVIEYESQTYDQMLAWYKEALKGYRYEDIEKNIIVEYTKYRDWKDQMYIEDQGGAEWHSIGISKNGGNKTTVRIVHDNWTWIFSTLFIRFAGVFIVLSFLWILLNINGFIMKKYFTKEEKK